MPGNLISLLGGTDDGGDRPHGGVGPFDGLLGAKTVSTSKTIMSMSWTWRAAPTVVRGRMEEESCSFWGEIYRSSTLSEHRSMNWCDGDLRAS